MKGFKVLVVIMAAAILTLGLSGISFAFHSGGVANCDGCHTMHNAQGTTSMTKNSKPMFSGNSYLLQGSDQASTCLNCHGGPTQSSYQEFTTGIANTITTPANYTPGGDFAWLQVAPSAGATTVADRRGHNIVAGDYGLLVSPTFTTAPGGSYPANQFYCSSCHDPHGTYRHTGGDPTVATDIKSPVFTTGGLGASYGAIVGSGSYGQSAADQGGTAANATVGVYRLLAGKQYLPNSVQSNAALAFGNDSPVAMAPGIYNVSEGKFGTTGGTAGLGGAAAELVVAYGNGMSEWCANCHGQILQDNTMGNLIHPAGAGAVLGVTTAGSNQYYQNYNAYVGSGNLTGTNLYSSLIPIEVGAGVLTHTGATSFGGIAPTATATSNVECLSCHRAHASGWKNMTRWDMATEFITTATGFGAGVTPGPDYKYSALQSQAAYNGRPYTAFVQNQRSLCNKCHVKD